MLTSVRSDNSNVAMVSGHSDVYFVADQDIMDASHTQVSVLVPEMEVVTFL